RDQGEPMKFRATIELAGKTATGIEVPAAVVTKLGSSKKPAVRVTIKGYTYRSTIATMGGRFMLPISAQVREAAGVAARDKAEVSSPRTLPTRGQHQFAIGKRLHTAVGNHDLEVADG